ncbi:thiamine pyrophosphate-binding protein [Mycolicibacterium flavescens]|uniref:acetolactate synthase n=1 Tax=Mycolicibacterium flavescens TaxID=1776 RepID=A0A1E3RNE2_MYCFV|nr:thiamine pyrophosphate-dependent enzyme [Mycolicibacterium flavescens]MCV7281938.1 thiamine pyrophosphate-binding protein [Mycolicibacterium flavescens]ODQ90932.1 acetolactate synthase [Mycolicibacterium flavescens]
MRVVDHIVEFLSAIGVSHIFGVDGANIEDLYDAAHFHADMTAVLAKHEFSAATMADGYSRGGGGLGVLAATSGGGALNTVPGLAEALASRVPVLAVIGQPPTTLEGRGAFQDTSGRNGAMDARDLFASVSVFCHRVTTPADIVAALRSAVAAARELRGPAVLLLPKDIQQSSIPATDRDRGDGAAAPRSADPHPIAHALRRAAGPVTIIAGEQVARDDARDELEELRALLRARVATVPDAKDVAGTPGRGSSSALGVTGVMGHPGVASALTGSALCLLIGTRMNVTASAGLDDALASVPVFSLGCASPYRPCAHVHTDDLRRSLATLVVALSGEGRPERLRVPATLPHTELQTPVHTGPGVRYRDAMLAFDDLLPAGVDIVVDAGNTGAAAIHHLPARRDGRFVVALGMGGMGYSFGAAIGVALARGSHVVVIAGDGSFYMHGMEIHTARQYRLPITFCLFDNHAHAMCVTREQIFYGARYSYNRFGESRLGAGLQAMFPGLPATDVTDIAGLRAALSAALETDGPAVISIDCSADEIPPFTAFLAHPPRPEGTHRHDT